MARETETTLARFRHEVQSVAIKLADARASTILDPVTGVINRREMERKLIEQFVSSGDSQREGSSILRFDIARFLDHVRRFGADASANLERRFATRLNEQIRPGDVLARWSPGRFVVIMQCALIEAAPRTAQITRSLEGEYSIEGLATSLSIAVLQDVVPAAQADSPDTLFTYLDSPFPSL